MFTDSQLESLRKQISLLLSKKRYKHSLGVEKCAVMLGKYCLPGFEDELSCAALLHDVTKELSDGEQLSILAVNDVSLSEAELESAQVFHSYTAPFVLMRDYPDFATENVVSAVRNHTVGDENMSVFDEIIFLSDYIEEGREYVASRELYDYVFSQMEQGNTEHNLTVLHNAALKSINHTISHLIEKNRFIIEKTLLTRNALLSKILHI